MKFSQSNYHISITLMIIGFNGNGHGKAFELGLESEGPV